MDTETPSLPVQQSSLVISRPTVPPKPRSSVSLKGDSVDEPRASFDGNTSSVGTQVNLLAKRKTWDSMRNDVSTTPHCDPIEPGVNTKSPCSGDPIKSPTSIGCGNKPALPPKPSPSSITQPRKSITLTSVTTFENECKSSPPSPSPVQSPIKPPARKAHAPYASIDELDTVSDHNSPPSEVPFQNKNDSVLNPTATSQQSIITPRQQATVRLGITQHHNVFQYPGVLPQSGISPSQCIQAQRKSTSLGRNLIFSPFTQPTSPFSRVSHLDLTSTSRVGNRLLSKQNSEGNSSNPLSPPPPPPRRRISHKPQSALGGDISSNQSLSISSPHSAPPVISYPTLYAVIDKEKKWEMRRRKEEIEKLNNNIFIPENKNDIELNVKEMSLDVRNRKSSSPLPILDIQEEKLLSTESISSSGSKSWLGKFIAQNSEEIGSIGDPEPPSPLVSDIASPNESFDSNVESTEDSIGVNTSFLFNHLNSISQQKNSKETSSPENELKSDESLEMERQIEQEINYEKTQLLTSTFVNNDNGEEKDGKKKDISVDGIGEKIKTIYLPSQNGESTELINDTTEGNSGEEETDGGTDTKYEDGFEELLEEKLEPILFLEGVTDAETLTDDAFDSKGNSDADLISEIVRSQEQFKSPSRRADIGGDEQKGKVSLILPEDIHPVILPPLISAGSFRRRSWTCSENTTSSFTESSPSSSSSSSLRERTSSISGSIHSHSTWVDEGELSTGALGDAENSDACPCQGGSIEEFNSNRPGGSSSGSFSRRRRIVNSIFASFGKSGISSNSNQVASRKTFQMRGPQSGRRKEKSKSHFFLQTIHPQKGKKVKSDVYLAARGTPARVNLEKLVVSSSQALLRVSVAELSDAEGGATKTTDKNEHLVSIQSPTVTEDVDSGSTLKPNARNPGDTASISSRCYDDILSGLGHKERQAFYVAREILTSERTFVDVLNLLTIDFPSFVKAKEDRECHTIITRTDLDFILGGLPNLKLVNTALLHDLEDRISSWKSNPKVSDIIIKTGPFLKHYSTYIRDYQKISNRFEYIREKSSTFARTVSEFEKLEKCRNLQLKHYMLKPVQRMPQYALLLGDYLKNLDPEENEDYGDTVKAISIVKEVAEHGNEAIRHQENAEKLVQLQNRLTQNVILKADRQLICEGELRKVCRKELQPRYFALMSDCLLCMNYAGSGTATVTKEFKLRYELPLTGMRVALSTNEDYQNEFSVISVTRSFNLVAKTPRERDDWLKALNIAIKRNIKRRAGSALEVDKESSKIGKVAPLWIADSRVTMCQGCTAEFTITFRRHHCRACGKVVCGNCSGNEAPLQYQNFEAARVCDDCYTYLMEEFDQENCQNSQDDIEAVRNRFKKGTPNISKKASKHKRSIPHRLEIHGNVMGSAMSGYLHWKEHRKAWKRQWFVLIDRVLYVYAASEDIAAIRGIPILGYEVELVSGGGENVEGDEGGRSIFQLTHSGQEPYIFQAESSSSAEKWIGAMQEATVFK